VPSSHLSSAVMSAGWSVISSPPAAAITWRRLFSVRSSQVFISCVLQFDFSVAY
jgi:hypothetical protein